MSFGLLTWARVRPVWSAVLLLALVLAPLPAARSTGAAPGTPALPAPCSRVERDDVTGTARWLEHCGLIDLHGDSETIARAALAAHAAELGLLPDGQDLVLLAVQPTAVATHVRFAQTHQGVPVYLGQVLVQYTPAGELQLINNHTVPSLKLDTAPAYPGLSADARVLATIGGGDRLRQPLERELVVYAEGGEPVLAWHVVAYLTALEGDLHFMISARNGEVLAQWDELWGDSGTGLVYHPNAVQTTGNTALRDNNDQTSPALDAARTQLTLAHLVSTTFQLKGSFVDLTAPGVSGCSLPYVPGQANEPTRVYNYTRDDDRFEEATTYAGVDGVQTWFQALGFTNANNRSIPIDVHCIPDDNSYYSSGDHALHFGDGGVDDAEDADVVLHEYGHAVQDNQVPGWGPGGNTEQRAMGEGFGDFLPGMYYINVGDPTYLSNYKYCIMDWDATSYNPVTPGNPGSGCLRWINGRDENTGNDIGAYSGTPSEVHRDGRYWSAALTCVYEGMGANARDNMMRLVLQHHFSLTPDSSNQAFERAVAALALADQNLFGGVHISLINNCALGRGLITQLTVPPPIVTYPAGGEVITPGSTISITWDRNGAPLNTSYTLESTDACTPLVLLGDDVESGQGAWTVNHVGGTADWSITTSTAHSPTHSWFAPDEAFINDQRLESPAITLGPRGVLSFWHRWALQTGLDGGVVELSTDGGGSWLDLGPYMTQNGYNGTLGASGNPLSGRQAFTGFNGSFVETRVDLSSFAGQTVRLRFREGDDAATILQGWWVDDVVVSQLPAWLPIGTSAPGATSYPWTTPTVVGFDYCVRLKGDAPGYTTSAYGTGAPFALVPELTYQIHLPVAFLNAVSP